MFSKGPVHFVQTRTLGGGTKMEIEFVVGLSPPGTSWRGLVKMREAVWLCSSLIFVSFLISTILLSLFLFLFPLSFFSFEHDSLLSLSPTGVFGGFIRILIMFFAREAGLPRFPLAW